MTGIENIISRSRKQAPPHREIPSVAGSVCNIIDLWSYSALSSSRSILKITGLVPSEQQVIIMFS